MKNHEPPQPLFSAYSKRIFLKTGLLFGISSGVALNFLSGCKNEAPEKEGEEHEEKEEEVSPAEDLMREHGLLNRILLVYDTLIARLTSGEQIPMDTLLDSANIIRNFIEDYHEKLEENYLFPRFQKANQLTDLVQVLHAQHDAGRNVTGQIVQLAKAQSKTEEENRRLVKLLGDFNRMYRPHEAREDTVLFPALKKLVSKNEYDALGEDFEKMEHEKFGEDGFDTMVDKVAEIEKRLGIYELAQFTPEI